MARIYVAVVDVTGATTDVRVVRRSVSEAYDEAVRIQGMTHVRLTEIDTDSLEHRVVAVPREICEAHVALFRESL